MNHSTYNELKILNIKEKQRIAEMLKEQFGISEIQGLIVQRGKERLFLFQGSFDPKKIKDIENTLPIERVGVYFAKIAEERDSSGKVDKKIRLSIEGSQILKNQIKKNIFELDSSQAEEWMKGREVLVNSGKKGFVIMKHKNDFLGTGKASEEKITNFIPKNRRLKEKNC